MFVITADRTAGGRGKAEPDLQYYHIPLMVYAPKHIQPGRFEKIASQIDVPPTILGLLNVHAAHGGAYVRSTVPSRAHAMKSLSFAARFGVR